jgi:uncharacterized protein (TIGR03067 family)
MRLFPIVAFVLPLLILQAARSDESNDHEKIQGIWLPSMAELAGHPLPEEVRKTIKLTIKGNEYTVTIGKNIDQGTIKLDSSKELKQLDVIGTKGPNKGKTILAIYKLTEDCWTICYDLSGNGRPTEFHTTVGSHMFLVTYRKEKQ